MYLKKYIAIFAISTTGVIGWEIYEKEGIDSYRLYKFIKAKIITPFSLKIGTFKI
jgi:hypothetical protein